MGILRVYLALCVVHNHALQAVFPWRMHWGYQAVPMFYIISGFYMAMVLSSARYAHVKEFYLSRFLRVFVPYWVVLAGVAGWSALFGLLTHDWLSLAAYADRQYEQNGTAGTIFAVLTNATLVGQDWVMFLTQPRGQPLAFTADFYTDKFPLWHYLVVPQCWSIGVEISFYAFAPFLNRLRSRWLILIALASTILRFAGYARFGTIDPWVYRFFPFEITLFLCGMLAFRFLPRVREWIPRWPVKTTRTYLIAALALLAVLALHVHLTDLLCIWLGGGAGLFISNAMWAVALPFVFVVFGNMTWDRLLGELSYPIYLVHIVVIQTLQVFGPQKFHLLGVTSAAVSILVAAGLYLYVVAPLDRKRHILTVDKPEKLDDLDRLSKELTVGSSV